MQCVWIFKRYFKSTIVNPDNVTAIYIQVLFQFSIQCKTAYKKNLFPYIWNMYREETTHSVLKIMFRNETLQCCDNWLPVQYITVIWFLLTWYPVYASLYGLSHDWSQSILFFIICWSLASLASISEISAERSNESLSSPLNGMLSLCEGLFRRVRISLSGVLDTGTLDCLPEPVLLRVFWGMSGLERYEPLEESTEPFRWWFRGGFLFRTRSLE